MAAEDSATAVAVWMISLFVHRKKWKECAADYLTGGAGYLGRILCI